MRVTTDRFMHDIRAIRDNPDIYDAGWARRGLSAQAKRIVDLDAKMRAQATAKQEAEAQRNAASKAVGQAKAQKNEAEAERLITQVAALKQRIDETSIEEARWQRERDDLLASLPNLPAPDAPDGADENANIEVRRWYKRDSGDPPNVELSADHVALGEALGLMDFEAAARMSGARFVALKGQLARLDRAIGQFMLDLQTGEHGYTEISPPLLVREEAVFGVGQLPKFAEDLFRTTDDRWLISTSEVPLTNLVREEITAEEELPLRVTALTPCFRSEAGASGKDTRGM